MNQLTFLSILAASALVLGGCSDDVDCVEEPDDPDCVASCMDDPTLPGCEDMGSVEDGGETDMPMDACGGCGTDEVCDTASETCVACLDEGDCTDGVCLVDGTDSTMNACVDCLDGEDCGGDTPVCTSENTCVGCEADTDCTDPANGQCDTDTNTCVPCDDSAQCTEDGAGVCDAGTCVECTIDTEDTECGDFSCDPATSECTTTERGTVDRCEACVADSECSVDHRCVETSYMEVSQGGHCLPVLPGTEVCPSGYPDVLMDEASLSGAAADDYCAPDGAFTTCEARIAIGNACDADTMPCPDGGQCETITGAGSVCTIPCDTVLNCPAGAPFDSCASYCGG